MKICSKCLLEKDISEFHLKKDKITPYPHCKACQNAYTKSHYEANKSAYKEKARKNDKKYKEIWFAYKATLKCEACGFSHVAALEFHHKNKDKSFNIGGTKNFCLKKRFEEVKKCIVLCSNCHKIHHYNERQNALAARMNRATDYESGG